MPIQKLPEYKVLYRELITKGRSYTDVALEYGVGKDAVISAFKNGARRNGDQWPIPRPDREARVKRGFQRVYIKAGIITELLQEKREALYGIRGDTLMVSAKQVVLRRRPSEAGRVTYHDPNSDCRVVTFADRLDRMDISRKTVQRYGNSIRECKFCAQWRWRQWVAEASKAPGVGPELIRDVVSGRRKELPVWTARTLLELLGEKPHEDLLSWKTTCRRKNKADADVAA